MTNLLLLIRAIPDILKQIKLISANLDKIARVAVEISYCIRSSDSNHRRRPAITTSHWNDS